MNQGALPPRGPYGASLNAIKYVQFYNHLTPLITALSQVLITI